MIKYMKILLLLIISCMSAHAQKYISGEEVKGRFEKNIWSSVDEYDQLYYRFIGKSQSLRMINDSVTLKPSKWCYMYGDDKNGFHYLYPSDLNKIYKKEYNKILLCWIGYVDKHQSEERKTKEMLKKTYGAISAKTETGKSVEAIPAKWLNDTVSIYDGVIHYGSFLTGREFPILVTNGELAGVVETRSFWDDFDSHDSHRGTLYGEISTYIDIVGQNKAFFLYENKDALSMFVLYYEINKHCPKASKLFSIKNKVNFSFPVYLWLTNDGTYECTILKEDKIPEKYFYLVDELTMAVKKLPKFLFAPERTFDNRYLSGPILRATFSNDSWVFEKWNENR